MAIRINAGGPATTANGTSWLVCSSTSACNGYVLNGSSYSTANTITLAANSAPANQIIYQTGRGTGTSNTSLDFAVPLANGSYLNNVTISGIEIIGN